MQQETEGAARKPEPDAALPRRLGPLLLTRRLGAGGMGTVYEAVLQDPSGDLETGARVAVKVLRDDLAASARGLARLQREADLGARVRHPGVVRPLALLQLRDEAGPCLALVMELVEGSTLRALMDEMGALPEPLARHVALRLAEALAAVHAEGIVHRDVKPENVLLTKEQGVKLADLGIARPDETAAALTTAGTFLGSLAYASPEHFGVGEPAPVSDLYSLGVVLHEAVAGKRPFPDGPAGAMVRHHLEKRPPRLGEIVLDVSPFLEQLVATLLQKKPEQRIASAAELAAILRDGEGSPWWRAQEAPSQADPWRARTLREASLAGRDAELGMLAATAVDALAGTGGALLVEGEAGVGKSRLVDELLTRLLASAPAPLVLHSAAEPGMSSGRSPLAEALVALFGASGLRRGLERHLEATPEMAGVVAAWALGMADASGTRFTREALHAAMGRLLASLAETQPVVWIVEDLHFATPEERAMISSLAAACRGRRALLVATTRPGLAPGDVAAFERPGSRRLVLPRLSARAVIDLLESLLSSRRLAEDLGGRVAASTDGNPYFVLEVVHDLKQRGLVQRNPDGTWTMAARISSIGVPTSVRSLLLDRVAGLSPDERALLDVAAMQGFHFDADLVARVIGSRRLAVLQSLALIERRWSLVRAVGGVYQFDHHQLQEVLASSVPSPLRQEYHALLAKALTEREGITPQHPPAGELAVRLARHALEGGLSDAAGTYLHAAITHLRARLSHEATLDLCRLALDRLPPRATGRSEAASRMAYTYESLGRTPEALEAAELAVAEGAASGNDGDLATAYHVLSTVLFRMAQFDRATEAIARGREHARRAGAEHTDATLLATQGAIAHLQGKGDEAVALLREAVARFHALESRVDEGVAMMNLAAALGPTAPDESLDLMRRAAVIAEESGELAHASVAQGNIGTILLERGRLREGEPWVRKSLENSRSQGLARTEATNLLRMATLALLRGDDAGCESWARQGLEVARAIGEQRVEGRLLVMLGDLAAAAGRRGDARSLWDEAAAVERAARSDRDLLQALLRVVQATWDDGDADRAAALLREALEVPGASRDALARAWSALVLGTEAPPRGETELLPVLSHVRALQALVAAGGAEWAAPALSEVRERLLAEMDEGGRERFLARGFPKAPRARREG